MLFGFAEAMRMGISGGDVEGGGKKKRFEELMKKMKKFPGVTWRTVWRVGREDPRRAIHALKVGSSLTLVSLLYLLEPLFDGVGQNAIWAVMTVVVVLEFTAGATLCKGLNRGIGTLLAGSLAFFIEYVATKSGRVLRATFIGGSVFAIGFAATYMRFFPYIKKNYDYGVVIFLLTFNLITVSSFRVDNVLKMAHQRFYTIAIGCGVCLLMSLLVFPNWSGEDLHNSTVSKLEGLLFWKTPRSVRALFKDPCVRLSGEVSKALKELADSIRKRRHISPEILSDHLQEALQDLNTALKSQPRLFLGPNGSHHSTNMLALAAATARQKSDKYLSSVKTDSSALFEWKSKRSTEQMKEAERKVLRPTLSKISITSLEFSEALPFAAFASLLVEMVARLDLVIEEVEELGNIARFKEFRPGDEVIVDCEETRKMEIASTLRNDLPTHMGD